MRGGQCAGAQLERRVGRLPSRMQRRGNTLTAFGTDKKMHRRLFRITLEKTLLDCGEWTERIRVQRRVGVLRQRVQGAGVACLRVVVVLVQGAPDRLDQRRLAIQGIGVQRANASGNFAAEPRGRQLVGERQQFLRERPFVHLAQPGLLTQYAVQTRQALRGRFGRVVRDIFGPGLERRDARRYQRVSSGRARQRAGKILSGAMIGNQHDQARQIGQRVTMLIQQLTGECRAEGFRGHGNREDSHCGLALQVR